MLRPNLIRQKLKSKEPTLSTHIHSVWPAEIEAIGHAGIYDYVEFVAEYGPSDLHDLDNMCRTSELYNLGSMIKISWLARRLVPPSPLRVNDLPDLPGRSPYRLGPAFPVAG